MNKELKQKQEFDAEQAKIAELFYRFMKFHKQHKDKKLTYLILCTASSPQDLKNLLGKQESVNCYLDGFHIYQGYGSLLSLMLATELDNEVLTDAIEMKKCMVDKLDVYEKVTKQ